MVVANTGDKDAKPDWSWFSERTKGFTQLKNVVTGKIKSWEGLEIQAGESFVFELMK